MRINISSIIISIVTASTVFAVPVQIEKRSWVLDKLGPLFTKAVQSLECGACVAAIVGAKDIAFINKNWVLDAGKQLCPTLLKKPADLCNGIIDHYGDAVLDSILKANILAGDGKLMCYSIGGICPAPPVSSGILTFPKPRPANPVVPAPSGQRVDVLHLSDWHVDEEYVPGAEAACNRPLCCRKYDNSPLTPTRAASSWGDYNCDSPVKLTKDLLGQVVKVANVSFAIMTGDVPPHDVWLETKDTAMAIEGHAYESMATLSTKVYPTVGNHETAPASMFPTSTSGGDNSWLYASLSDEWSRWLPSDAVNSVKNYGAYSASPAPGLRIISLNTNFCYRVNVYLYVNTKDYDPNGEINWLVTQLQAAEDAGERVWIIGHVPPSKPDCLQNWSALYYQAIQRYSPHVVAEQFFGHTHFDEFALYYGPGAKSSQNAISTAWIGPSVTPYTNINPGFRVYKADSKSWNIFDSQTYIANLDQATSWDTADSSPNWHLEYSARQTYGALVPIADNAPLSASWWHNVTAVFEKNDAAFQQYWTFRGKSANLLPACAAGSTCPAEMICDMRAGRSSDSCTDVKLGGRKRSIETEVEALDLSGFHSLYKRADPKPWNQGLCGLPFGI
ncbi:hypothetical protein BGX26_010003 [Mortierella sp. AD094]|nr:hypothetical protein BGX26_010003 [Mortierella sp. AD094]